MSLSFRFFEKGVSNMAKKTTTTKKTATSRVARKATPTRTAEPVNSVPAESVEAVSLPVEPRAEVTEMSAEIRAVSHEMIAHRAYEIWREQGGSDMENWLRAERELTNGGLADSQ